jgi:hypothetical protein
MSSFHNSRPREQDLQRQLALTKQQLRDLRTSNDSNQAKLFDHSQRQGQCPQLPNSVPLNGIYPRSRGCCKTRRSRYDCCRSGTCKQSRGYNGEAKCCCLDLSGLCIDSLSNRKYCGARWKPFVMAPILQSSYLYNLYPLRLALNAFSSGLRRSNHK